MLTSYFSNLLNRPIDKEKSLKYNNLILFGSAILLSAAVAVSKPVNVSADPVIYNPENPNEPITPKEPEPVTSATSESSEEIPNSSKKEIKTSPSDKTVESTENKTETPTAKKIRKRYIKSDFFINPVVAVTESSQNGLGSGNSSFTGSQAAQTAYLLSGIILLGRKAI